MAGITRGRVLNGELYAQKLQVNLSSFVYRLFHEDFSSLVGPDERRGVPTREEKSSWNSLWTNADKLTSVISVVTKIQRFIYMKILRTSNIQDRHTLTDYYITYFLQYVPGDLSISNDAFTQELNTIIVNFNSETYWIQWIDMIRLEM